MLEEKDEVSCNWLRNLFHRRWFVLIMWQICSIFLCAMGVVSVYLTNMAGATLPFFMLVITYVMLSIVHIWHIQKTEIALYKYIILALLNNLGDAFSVMSYSFTSLASSLLLTTTVVFWVVPLSYFAFRARFSMWQLLSLVLGAGGVALIFVADGAEGSKWKGNMFAVFSAMSFAGSTVLQEYLVHNASAAAYLPRFTISASFISAIACGALEWKQVRDYEWNYKTVLLCIGYAAIQTVYYSFCPYIMQHSSAAEMNLSFLTSNFFSLLISILVFGQAASWLYLVGFFCIPIAITVYSLCPYKLKNNSMNNSAVSEEHVSVNEVSEEVINEEKVDEEAIYTT